MNKILLFLVAVVGGTLGIILLLNQKELTQSSNITVSPTIPPFTLNQPSQIPTTVTPRITVSQTSTTSSPTPTLSPKAQTAILKTTKGDITLSLFSDFAPNTVNNLIQKAKSGFYNNLTFHRVEDWVIQGGDPLGNGTGGGKISTELNDKPFVIGSLGVARGGDIKVSNDAQFFITKKDASWLNGQYTNFGIVTKGMDVVEKISIGDKILSVLVE